MRTSFTIFYTHDGHLPKTGIVSSELNDLIKKVFNPAPNLYDGSKTVNKVINAVEEFVNSDKQEFNIYAKGDDNNILLAKESSGFFNLGIIYEAINSHNDIKAIAKDIGRLLFNYQHYDIENNSNK